MASLTGSPPSSTYGGILKTTDNANVTASEKQITDGDGNNTGLKLTSTKAIANTLKIENAPTSSSETTALVIDSNGDVYERALGTNAFSGTNLLVARTSADTSPLTFTAVGSTSADSIQVGSGLSIISNNAIQVSNSGSLLHITGSVVFTPSGAIDDVTVTLDVQSTGIKAIREVVSSGTGDKQINIDEWFTTTVNDTEVQLEVTKNVGTPTVSNRSFLSVEIVN